MSYDEPGELLLTARTAAGLTQTELGRRTGVPRSAISMYETGARQPGADVFLRLLAGADHHVALRSFSDELRRRGRALEDLLRLASELPHHWPGDQLSFPAEVWRTKTDVAGMTPARANVERSAAFRRP